MADVLIKWVSLSGVLVALTLPGCLAWRAVEPEAVTWAVVNTQLGSCEEILHFGRPRAESDVCVSVVDAVTSCEGRDARSPKRYVALLGADARCDSLLAAREFFPESAVSEGFDDELIQALSHVASLLKAEQEDGSQELHELGTEVVHELRDKHMSALAAVRLMPIVGDEVGRYRFTFHLRRLQKAVVLYVDADGADPEWALLVE